WSTSRFETARARFHPELADCWRPGSGFDHHRFLPTVAEPDVGLHAASSQKSHGPHGSKKGCQSPCRTERFARSVAAVDSPAPASTAISYGWSRPQPANGADAAARKS